MDCLYAVLYLTSISLLLFGIGRLLPGTWFHPDRPPFGRLAFETEAFYRMLGVPKWQKKLPDMSRICRSLMPQKALTPESSLPQIIQETCIAEWTHVWLGILGFGCMRLTPGKMGCCPRL